MVEAFILDQNIGMNETYTKLQCQPAEVTEYLSQKTVIWHQKARCNKPLRNGNCQK